MGIFFYFSCNVIKVQTVLNSENDDSEDEYCYNKIVAQAPLSDTDMVSFCYQIACGMVRVLCSDFTTILFWFKIKFA